MTRHKILIQNLSGSKLGRVRGGGNCARLRIDIHNIKPTFVILSEVNEGEGYKGTGVFRGYSLQQYSFNNARGGGGVAVFAMKNVTAIEDTIRNSQGGHFSVGAYLIGGTKVVLGAIYGPSSSSDAESCQVFGEFTEYVRELARRLGTQTVILGGISTSNLINIGLNLALSKL